MRWRIGMTALKLANGSGPCYGCVVIPRSEATRDLFSVAGRKSSTRYRGYPLASLGMTTEFLRCAPHDEMGNALQYRREETNAMQRCAAVGEERLGPLACSLDAE